MFSWKLPSPPPHHHLTTISPPPHHHLTTTSLSLPPHYHLTTRPRNLPDYPLTTPSLPPHYHLPQVEPRLLQCTRPGPDASQSRRRRPHRGHDATAEPAAALHVFHHRGRGRRRGRAPLASVGKDRVSRRCDAFCERRKRSYTTFRCTSSIRDQEICCARASLASRTNFSRRVRT